MRVQATLAPATSAATKKRAARKDKQDMLSSLKVNKLHTVGLTTKREQEWRFEEESQIGKADGCLGSATKMPL